MEDGEGERKTKTISFTVYEDEYDAPVEAVLEALFDYEMEGRRNFSRTDAVTEALVSAILELGECRFGEKRTVQIMEEGFRKHQEEIGLHGCPPEINEPQ